jgi:hypothetical protein
LSIFDFLNGSIFYLAKVDISEWVQKIGYVRVERVIRECAIFGLDENLAQNQPD